MQREVRNSQATPRISTVQTAKIVQFVLFFNCSKAHTVQLNALSYNSTSIGPSLSSSRFSLRMLLRKRARK